MRFVDQVVVITGAANGIGKAAAIGFAGEGAYVAALDVDFVNGNAMAKSLIDQGHKALFVKCDVSNKESVENAINQVVQKLGTINVLVNNAGVNQSVDFLEMTESEWDRVISTDLKGTFLMGQAVAKVMVSHGKPGVIVNVSSVMSVLAMGNQAAYCAAKGGVNQLTKSMALALIDKAIRVNGVAPGPVMTDLMQKAVDLPGKFEKLLERMPVGRIGECKEIAKTIMFLASDDASYFVGQTIFPDGGRSIQAFPQEME